MTNEDGPPPRGLAFASPTKLEAGSRPARILMVAAEHSGWGLQRRLEALGAQVHTLDSGRGLMEHARALAPDLILLDQSVPDLHGLRALRALKKDSATHSIPVIVLSATDDVHARVRILEEGAADCFVRNPVGVPELTARIRAVLRVKTREDLLRRRVAFLEELAASDPLTSLLNRRAFIDRLHLEMERAMRSYQPLSCLILDIDWFKTINDRYGHQVGDDVLRQIAKVLVDGRRGDEAVCRYGGEEFVWLLPGSDRQALLERAEWLRRTIEETEIPTAEGSFRISVSLGASTYRFKEHGRLSAHLLLEHADAALLEAKKQGKNRVVFRDPMPEPVQALPDAEPTEGPALIGPWTGAPPPGVDVFRPPPARTMVDSWEAWGKDAQLQEELRTLLHSSVKVLTAALEAKDPETVAHCQRVAGTAVAIATELNLPAHEIERIKLAALLHDLGKLAVPESILKKPGPLSREEWHVVRKHPERGAAMLQDARPFSHLVDLILYHQESFDGSGYPDGLAGHEIPLGSRIIRVADAFEAMLSDRAYRPRKTLEEAKVELKRMAGSALDPAVVDALLRLIETMSPLEIQLTIWRSGGLSPDGLGGRGPADAMESPGD
ncbi:MAG: diguanylate cyclase [Armatimonadota bacterium]|nr:diguanylate cyclase [Armatimonadota bacterium]